MPGHGNPGYGDLRRAEQRRRSATKWGLVMLLLGSAAAAAYWYFNPQQRPAWLADHLPVSPEAKVTLYRWKDNNGQWVVTDQPPTDRDYETVEYRHDSNVLPFDPAADNDG